MNRSALKKWACSEKHFYVLSNSVVLQASLETFQFQSFRFQRVTNTGFTHKVVAHFSMIPCYGNAFTPTRHSDMIQVRSDLSLSRMFTCIASLINLLMQAVLFGQ